MAAYKIRVTLSMTYAWIKIGFHHLKENSQTFSDYSVTLRSYFIFLGGEEQAMRSITPKLW